MLFFIKKGWKEFQLWPDEENTDWASNGGLGGSKKNLTPTKKTEIIQKLLKFEEHF